MSLCFGCAGGRWSLCWATQTAGDQIAPEASSYPLTGAVLLTAWVTDAAAMRQSVINSDQRTDEMQA